jgi:hypothetical protein
MVARPSQTSFPVGLDGRNPGTNKPHETQEGVCFTAVTNNTCHSVDVQRRKMNVFHFLFAKMKV